MQRSQSHRHDGIIRRLRRITRASRGFAGRYRGRKEAPSISPGACSSVIAVAAIVIPARRRVTVFFIPQILPMMRRDMGGIKGWAGVVRRSGGIVVLAFI